jgi:uncharacterized membrane protein (DUF106 family)
MAFEALLDPVFSPLLSLPIVLAIAIVSIVMSLIITFMYKWLTDQKLMKDLKDEMKAFQKQIKELRSDPQKAMAVQKKAMETNMKYMMNSMKPTLFTFIPIILIFGWLNANLAFEPIPPDTPFTTTATFQKGAAGTASVSVPEQMNIVGNATQPIIDAKATWAVMGAEGQYFIDYKYAEETQRKRVIITNGKEYEKVEERIKNSAFKSLRINNAKIKPFGSFAIFGYQPGWLATYIIFSIISSMGLRRALKIY